MVLLKTNKMVIYIQNKRCIKCGFTCECKHNDSYWGYNNVAYITPNPDPRIQVFRKIKYGTFNLDAIKLTGESCLDKSFT